MKQLLWKSTKNYFTYGLFMFGFAAGGAMLVGLITFAIYASLAAFNINPPFPLRNYQSGLADHARYLESFSEAVAMLACIVFLVSKSLRKKTIMPFPWIIAAAIAVVLLILSMYDRSRPAFTYPLSEAATGSMQVFVYLPILLGYATLLWVSLLKNRNKPKKPVKPTI